MKFEDKIYLVKALEEKGGFEARYGDDSAIILTIEKARELQKEYDLEGLEGYAIVDKNGVGYVKKDIEGVIKCLEYIFRQPTDYSGGAKKDELN